MKAKKARGKDLLQAFKIKFLEKNTPQKLWVDKRISRNLKKSLQGERH